MLNDEAKLNKNCLYCFIEFNFLYSDWVKAAAILLYNYVIILI